MSSFELIRRSIIRYYRFIPGDNALIQRYLQILELGGLVFCSFDIYRAAYAKR
jgi:hypothetical protein